MIRLILLVVMLLVGFAASVRSRFGALLFYIWFALFRPQEWVWTDITSLRLSLVIGLLLVVSSLATGVMPNLTHPLSVGGLLLLGAAFVAQNHAVNPELSWYWCQYLAKLVVVSLFLVTLVSTRKRLVVLIAVISASFGFYTAKAGLVSFLSGGLRFGAGQAGAFSDSNGYAIAGVMVVYLLVATAQNTSLRWLARITGRRRRSPS